MELSPPQSFVPGRCDCSTSVPSNSAHIPCDTSGGVEAAVEAPVLVVGLLPLAGVILQPIDAVPAESLEAEPPLLPYTHRLITAFQCHHPIGDIKLVGVKGSQLWQHVANATHKSQGQIAQFLLLNLDQHLDQCPNGSDNGPEDCKH